MQVMLSVSFVLYQTYDVTEEGQQLASGYGVTEFPVVLVVDPVTGAPMRRWFGYVSSGELVEALVPFMDTSFDDPRASRLAASSFKKKHSGSVAATGLPNAAAVEEGPALEEDPTPEDSAEKQGTRPIHREEEGEGEEEEEDNDVIHREAQERAMALLPEEPSGDSCRVAVRFPDGKRAQRKFARDCPVSMLRTWCVSLSTDAASGRPFVLSHTIPGAPNIEFESDATMGEAGVADCMLSMRWA